MKNDHPDTGDIVIGLSPETRGHWNIAEIHHREGGIIEIKFIDHWNDEPFRWTGTLEQYHKSFVHELDYNGRTE